MTHKQRVYRTCFQNNLKTRSVTHTAYLCTLVYLWPTNNVAFCLLKNYQERFCRSKDYLLQPLKTLARFNGSIVFFYPLVRDPSPVVGNYILLMIDLLYRLQTLHYVNHFIYF